MEKIIVLSIIKDFKNKFNIFNCHPGMHVAVGKKIVLEEAVQFLGLRKEKSVDIYICAFPSLWEIGHYFVTREHSVFYYGIKIQRPFLSRLLRKKAKIKIDVDKCSAHFST